MASEPMTDERLEELRQWVESGQFLPQHEAEELLAEIDRLRRVERRFCAMLPLFQEARDALPAISLASAKLRGISLSLADRMDDVGIADRWKSVEAAEAAKEQSNG